MRLSDPATRWTCELPPAFGWTGWSMQMPSGVCDCETPSQGSGRV